MTIPVKIGSRLYLSRPALDDLIQALRRRGYSVLGPRMVDGAISLGPIESAAQLPQGLSDQQDGGSYRVVEGDPELVFQYVVGPDGPKRYLFPANLRLFEFHVEQDNFVLDVGPPQVPKLAMLGVRACELAAIEVQDRVFGMDDPRMFRCESEPWYTQIRQETLLIAVNCVRPSGTCFCASWGTGPEATKGFDLALTELRDGFLVHVGSKRGATLAEELPVREPTEAELELAADQAGARPGPHGPAARYGGAEGTARRGHRVPGMGRGGPALPLVRQLHDGLPYLLLLHGHRHDQSGSHERGCPDPAVGIVLYASVHVHDFRAGAEHDPRPLPALAAAQTGDLVGAIRLQRLRGLRTLHHLVSGGHRSDRGSAAPPPTEPCPRRPRTRFARRRSGPWPSQPLTRARNRSAG